MSSFALRSFPAVLVIAVGCGLAAACAAASPPATETGGPVHSRSAEFSANSSTGDRHMGIQLLGLLSLRPVEFNDVPAVELSGLAWDEDEGLLYAVSDQGAVLHIRPTFENGTLAAARVIAAHRLTDTKGNILKGDRTDSEGLVALNAKDGVRGNTALAVSFERSPRVSLFTPLGRKLRPIGIAATHRNIHAFRGRNRALEALAHHPALGWLTGPERPMRGRTDYGIRDAKNRVWRLPPHGATNASLVAMETLDDGGLLTLERGFDLSTATVIIALRRTEPLNLGNAGRVLSSDIVAVLDSREAVTVDNFEGLTHHRDNRYFIVSDDNQNFFQTTFLLYFALTQ